MVEVVPVRHPRLKGGNPFGFRTHLKKSTNRRFQGTPKDHGVLGEIVSRVEQKLEILQHFPCQFELSIGVENGVQVLDGKIDVYDQKARVEAETVMRSVQASLTLFWATYPEASFKIDAHQEMSITKIHPHGT
jgi:hypothetical protein